MEENKTICINLTRRIDSGNASEWKNEYDRVYWKTIITKPTLKCLKV